MVLLTLQIAEELLNRGVSISAQDRYGCHAVHYAALRNNAVLIKFLLGQFSYRLHMPVTRSSFIFSFQCYIFIYRQIPDSFKSNQT